MSREEAIRIIKIVLAIAEDFEITVQGEEFTEEKCKEAVEMATKALEQESKTEQFAKWVATEIFDDMWEYNKDAFAEIACRKLEKLGIVGAKGDEWELIEEQERSEV